MIKIVIYNVSYNVNRFKIMSTPQIRKQQKWFGTAKISCNLDFYTSNRRHFRKARSLKTSAYVLFPREMCSNEIREYNKTEGTQNRGHRGSNTRQQLCEISDHFKEICQENRHRAGLGKTSLYQSGMIKAKECCFQKIKIKQMENIFDRQVTNVTTFGGKIVRKQAREYSQETNSTHREMNKY